MTNISHGAIKTNPETFILESLRLADEAGGDLDGKLLGKALKLCGKEPRYYYIRSLTELESFAEVFESSNCRYLHLSCHGNKSTIALTFDSISFDQFSEIFRGKLNGKRVFISGCLLGNKAFASTLFSRNPKMLSLTAPRKRVDFDQCMAFWTSFYYLMHNRAFTSMKKVHLRSTLNKLSCLFDMPIAHYYMKGQKSDSMVERIFDGSGK